MAEAHEAPAALHRPTGSGMITTGWVLLVGGAGLAIIGAILPEMVQPYSYVDPEPNPAKWPVTYIGIALAAIGVPTLLTGKVIRAMFFLPGRAVRESDVSITSPTVDNQI